MKHVASKRDISKARARKFKMPNNGPDPVERFLGGAVIVMLIFCLIVGGMVVYGTFHGEAEALEIEGESTLEASETSSFDWASDVSNRMAGYFQTVRDSFISIQESVSETLAQQQEEGMEWVQDYWNYTYSYDGYHSGYVSGDPDGLNSFVGVVDGPNGVETAYSSNVLYHVNTSEWTPDEYGFYRTDDGYYVVASSDYEQGTVIETSRGEAKVLDTGCASGVTDFYTNW